MRTRILVVAGILLVVGLLVALVIKDQSTAVDIEVSPNVASLKLENGKSVHTGINQVRKGKHIVTASFAGFATQQVSFTAAASSVPKVLILLLPNSQTGQDWLTNHPSEQNNRQKIGGEQYSATTTQAIQKNPLLPYLPYIASDASYRIDYGGGSSNGSNIQYYITYISGVAKANALNWISTQKVDPSTLNISYIQDSLLPTLPYNAIDFELSNTSPPGTAKPQLTAELRLSQADASDASTAQANYQQEVMSYITSLGANPNNYSITYQVITP